VTTTAPPFAGLPQTSLPARLSALSSLVRIASGRSGPGGFSPELLADAEALLERAGERQRLSAAHTVVTLAGGTGSGKSSLFNALAGANFSPAAVTRPATRYAHACVWGMEGAAPLLDWLGVERRYRYARASALDAGETALSGLLLLDLPDHDSVAAGAASAVDRLISLADLMVWVLDPQKYADAAVHSRFLSPLARHAPVTTVVLNQCDLLTPQQIQDCEEDLRRLLDSEGLGEARVLPVSAATGAGLGDLRQLLADAVSARQTAAQRIAADIDTLIAKFGAYADPAAVTRHAAAAGVSGASLPAGAPLAGVAENGEQAPSATDGRAAGSTSANGITAGGGSSGSASGVAGSGAAGSGAAGGGEAGGGSGSGPAGDGVPGNGASAAGAVLDAGATSASPAARRPPWEEGALTGADDADNRAGPEADVPDPENTAIESVPARPALDVADAFAHAAGLAAVTDALEDVRQIHASRYLSWPAGRLAEWLPRRDPVRAGRLGSEARAAVTLRADVQQSEIDSAITVFAGAVGAALPDPWPRTVREAARSRAGEIRGALSAAIGDSMPAEDAVAGWWRLVWSWQWLLVAMVIAGIGWMGAIVAVGVVHAMGQHPPALLGSVVLLPWLGAMVIALLLLGWLTASGSQNVVTLAADRERERMEILLREHIDAVARDLVVIPAGSELAEYARFCAELTAAAGA
jgi:GTP-binding protein EngB required for normal cell division